MAGIQKYLRRAVFKVLGIPPPAIIRGERKVTTAEPLVLNVGCYVQGGNPVFIGRNFRMGPGVAIIGSNHNLDDYDLHDETEPLVIGDNVWIGANSVVLPGVHIGDNVVIGAGSVVTHDIPPDTIAWGAPAEPRKEKRPYQGVHT